MANYDRKDHFYRKAKAEGYRSRAAYKLIELDDKYQFLKNAKTVLDLGCFPGGWLQVAAERAKPGVNIVGIDLKDVVPLAVTPRAKFEIIKGDIRDAEAREQLQQLAPKGYDIVLSDMSPNLSGVKLSDTARSIELVDLAFAEAGFFLKKGGNVVVKAFPSQEIEDIFRKYRKEYQQLLRTRLKSTRNTSNELYFFGKGYLGRE